MPVALVQHPFGQDAALQTHAPPLHSCPAAVLHPSHVPPFEPHSVLLSFMIWTQLPLSQQPGQLPPLPQLQIPAEQVSPLPQGPQAAPPVPHSPEPCPA